MTSSAVWGRFVERFRARDDGINVWLDWDALTTHAENNALEIQVLEVKPGDPLSRLFAPWYRDATGKVASWDHAGAVPYSFAEIQDGTANLSAHHRDKIDDICRDLERDLTKYRTLDLPTYAIGESQDLVLDGNHRFAALVRTSHIRTLVRVRKHRIVSEVSSRILPDLAYWENKN